MNNPKILKLAVALLLVLNIATISTILVRNTRSAKSMVIDKSGQTRLSSKYFANELSFDGEQTEAFRQANRQFRPKAKQIVKQIDSLKTELFAELNTSTPDTVLIRKISSEIGVKHGELKAQTAEFYLNVKCICNTEQIEKLQSTFSPLFCDKQFEKGRHGRHRGK